MRSATHWPLHSACLFAFGSDRYTRTHTHTLTTGCFTKPDRCWIMPFKMPFFSPTQTLDLMGNCAAQCGLQHNKWEMSFYIKLIQGGTLLLRLLELLKPFHLGSLKPKWNARESESVNGVFSVLKNGITQDCPFPTCCFVLLFSQFSKCQTK